MEPQQPFVEVSAENARDLIEQSKNSVVVFLFWAEQIPESVTTKDALTSIVGGYGDKLIVGLVDVAQQGAIAQQLGVRGVPCLRVIQEGKVTGQLDGPQTVDGLREFLDPYTLSGAEKLKQSIAGSIAEEDWDTALQILQEAISEEPTNHLFRVECADVMVLKGDLTAAKQILDTVPDDVTERNRPMTRLEIAQDAAGMGSVDEAAAEVETNPEDLESRYKLSILLAAERRFEEALEHAMKILQTDRTFRDDLGRETMVRVFYLMGNESEVVTQYRRKMFAFMH